MTTQNGAPSDPIVNPSTTVPLGDVTAFMQGPMPVPSEVERQVAQSAATEVAPPPLETPVQQPHIVPQPLPIQPGIEQPVLPVQPQPIAPQQPAQPTPAELQQQINDLTTQAQQSKTVYEAQRADTESREQAAQLQQITNASQQYGMQQYQKYLAGGTTDETAKQWATNDAQLVYQAYGANIQQQQATTQAQAIAKQHGISQNDIPAGLPQQAMQQFASMKAELNRLGGQTQAVSQNQMTTQTFDSGQGTAPANAMDSLLSRLGDPLKPASAQDKAAWYQLMTNQNPNL